MKKSLYPPAARAATRSNLRAAGDDLWSYVRGHQIVAGQAQHLDRENGSDVPRVSGVAENVIWAKTPGGTGLRCSGLCSSLSRSQARAGASSENDAPAREQKEPCRPHDQLTETNDESNQAAHASGADVCIPHLFEAQYHSTPMQIGHERPLRGRSPIEMR
jgi:hypothetical protein